MPDKKPMHIISMVMFTLFLVLFGTRAKPQIPLGIWQGNFGHLDIMVRPIKIVLELYKENDSSITGATHLYYPDNKYEHYKVNATFNAIDSTYTISEDSVLSFKTAIGVRRLAGTYKMKLQCRDSIYTLTGSWKTHSKIFFKYRTVSASFSQEIDKPAVTQQPKNADPSSQENNRVLKRHSEIQSLIEITRGNIDTVEVEIYDNGIIDNDSISLYFDDLLLISKTMISTSPIILYIPTGEIKSISRLKLIAESLGSIPPCTAVMIIKIDNKRYEVTLSSNFEKNAVVEFFLKE